MSHHIKRRSLSKIEDVHEVAKKIFLKNRLLASDYKPKILKKLQELVNAEGEILLSLNCNEKEGLWAVLRLFVMNFEVSSEEIDSCKLAKKFFPLSFKIEQKQTASLDQPKEAEDKKPTPG